MPTPNLNLAAALLAAYLFTILVIPASFGLF